MRTTFRSFTSDCLFAGCLSGLLLSAACSGSTPSSGEEPDLSATSPDLATTPPDMAQGPDLAGVRCELPPEFKLIDKVSTGMVTFGTLPADPSVTTAEIDATAGGSAEASKNPYVYLDLINNKKAQITDVQSLTSGDWDIAFKRWQIKINSGDSGPGGVTTLYEDGKELAEVKTAPVGKYEADDYLDDKCNLKFDRINGLGTAMSTWYDYPMMVVPWKRTYVLKRRDGKGHVKLQIMAYYKGMAGGNYVVNWALLP